MATNLQDVCVAEGPADCCLHDGHLLPPPDLQSVCPCYLLAVLYTQTYCMSLAAFMHVFVLEGGGVRAEATLLATHARHMTNMHGVLSNTNLHDVWVAEGAADSCLHDCHLLPLLLATHDCRQHNRLHCHHSALP